MLNKTLNHLQQAKLWYAAVTTHDFLVRELILETLCPDELTEAACEGMYELFAHVEADHIKSIGIIEDHLLAEARARCGN